MEYTFQDLENIIEDAERFAAGNFMLWMRSVWILIEEYKLNICCTYSEHIQFYSLIYGLCKIYYTFTDKISDTNFDDDLYLNIDFDVLGANRDDEEQTEAVQNYLNEVISDSDNMSTGFDLLGKKLDASKVFAALYYSMNYSNYSLQSYETDEYYYGNIKDEDERAKAICSNEDYERRKYFASCSDNEIYDDILNDINIDKCETFEWITSYM